LGQIPFSCENILMRGLNTVIATAFLLLIGPVHLNAQKPVWQIDLDQFGGSSKQDGPATGLKFYGPLVVVYSGSIYDRTMHPILVIEAETGRPVPMDRMVSVSLPSWDECNRTLFKKPFPEVNVVDCRDHMTIEQVGGIGRGPTKGDAEYFLQEGNSGRALLLRNRCSTSDPRFVGEQQILLTLCNGKQIVVNKQGQKIYDFPKLIDPYITSNMQGTRFVVQERNQSLLGQLNDTTDKKRMKVFRSSDGKKLFEYRWGQVDGDRLNDGRVALSDDGSMVALIRGNEVMLFAVASGPDKTEARPQVPFSRVAQVCFPPTFRFVRISISFQCFTSFLAYQKGGCQKPEPRPPGFSSPPPKIPPQLQ
jgi:hypothetical protein